MTKIIYKYFRVNQYLYDTLISNQLFFSSINQFNDPYDCHMTVLEDIPIEDFKVFLDAYFSEESREKYLAAFKENPKEFVQPFINMFRDWINNFGICCFTKEKNNLLLWSHYADSHKGVCLGFDYDLMIKKFNQYEEVEYSDTPFYFDLKHPQESVSKTLLRKSRHWEYEREIRFVMERSKNADFFLEALVEVNFGTRCNKRDRLNIQYLISRMGYPKCDFYNANIDKKEYTVEFTKSYFEELKKDVMNDSRHIPFSKEVKLDHLLK
ncbi:hypothetical protein DR864_27250 [Runella rosea]|uniref:DUF2971 domain-containing protein n=1 Tax=Runella rosea TaxID=2259595 RepID=A0A344TR99_9BACT|nr:DUF2971 domain-containing protein [Runella rosea]AXE21170.1 hypothetical protein DR864_27250 [Runella rosea]